MAKAESMQKALMRVFLEAEGMTGVVPHREYRGLDEERIVRQLERQLSKVQRAVLMYTFAAEQSRQSAKQGMANVPVRHPS